MSFEYLPDGGLLRGEAIDAIFRHVRRNGEIPGIVEKIENVNCSCVFKIFDESIEYYNYFEAIPDFNIEYGIFFYTLYCSDGIIIRYDPPMAPIVGIFEPETLRIVDIKALNRIIKINFYRQE
jgi:hypothetical protein